MFEFFLSMLGTFGFYAVLLPLAGVVIGASLYIGSPYLIGVLIAGVVHKLVHGSFLDLGAFWVIALLWCLAILFVRKGLKKIHELEYSWHQGHYLAASTLLLAGRPHRRMKRSMAQ